MRSNNSTQQAQFRDSRNISNTPHNSSISNNKLLNSKKSNALAASNTEFNNSNDHSDY